MSSLRGAYRRIVYGHPVIVVSGLPRSGTSMMMRMLEAGGIPVWFDDVRQADEKNPRGYYELERVRDLASSSGKAWVRAARGRAIKVVSALLEHLPANNNYRVVFMHRDLHEILASQASLLAARGQSGFSPPDDAMRSAYESHLRRVKTMVANQPGVAVLDVDYGNAIRDPTRVARDVEKFLRRRLTIPLMVAAVEEQLYRFRR